MKRLTVILCVLALLGLAVWAHARMGMQIVAGSHPAAATAGISDNFSSDTSANYTAIGSYGMSISSGYAYGATQYQRCAVYHETTTGSANHYVQADLEIATASASFVVIGYDTSGSTGYAIVLTTTSIKLFGINAGTFSELSNKYWVASFSDGTLYTIKAVVSGNNFTVFVNGSQVMERYGGMDGIVNDTTYTPGQYIGIGWDRLAGYNPRVDNLSGGAS